MTSVSRSIKRSQEVQSLPTRVEKYLERVEPKEEQNIYCFSIIIESLAVDGENEPEDTQVLTAYFKEYPFEFEINEWAFSWINYGYRIIDKFLVEHKKLNTDKHVFETVWSRPVFSYEPSIDDEM